LVDAVDAFHCTVMAFDDDAVTMGVVGAAAKTTRGGGKDTNWHCDAQNVLCITHMWDSQYAEVPGVAAVSVVQHIVNVINESIHRTSLVNHDITHTQHPHTHHNTHSC